MLVDPVSDRFGLICDNPQQVFSKSKLQVHIFHYFVCEILAKMEVDKVIDFQQRGKNLSVENLICRLFNIQ